jgi:predicted NBD/HSP70 family sugar kinase
MGGVRIGVDLGGTKIEAIALEAGGREVFRKRVSTPRGDYDATVAAISGLVSEIDRNFKTKPSVGIGIPGAMEGPLVKNANSHWLIGRPFKADLERAVGREVRIENDANCFALSEAVDGALERRSSSA